MGPKLRLLCNVEALIVLQVPEMVDKWMWHDMGHSHFSARDSCLLPDMSCATAEKSDWSFYAIRRHVRLCKYFMVHEKHRCRLPTDSVFLCWHKAYLSKEGRFISKILTFLQSLWIRWTKGLQPCSWTVLDEVWLGRSGRVAEGAESPGWQKHLLSVCWSDQSTHHFTIFDPTHGQFLYVLQ